MKKKLLILIVLILFILTVPIPSGVYKDGGTKEFSALTYKIVDWNKLYGEGNIYSKTKVYFFPYNFLSIDRLFAKEEKHLNSEEYKDIQNNEKNPEEQTNRDENIGEYKEISYEFNARYIRSGSYGGDSDFPIVKYIKSREELEKYVQDNHADYIINMSNPSFLDACSQYDKEFFSNKMLILLVIEEGSGSIRHKVNGISRITEDGEERLKIDVDRKVPEVGTDDMALWHLIIETEKNALPPEEKTYVFIDGKNASLDGHYVSHSVGVANISFTLPKGWEYRVGTETKFGFTLEVYSPNAPDRILTFEYSDFMLGFCGTGLTSKTIQVGKEEAVELTYDNKAYWDVILFNDKAGAYCIRNTFDADYWNETKDQINRMLNSLTISDGCVSESEAIRAAKDKLKPVYDSVRVSFEAQTGLFTVDFYKIGSNDSIKAYVTHEGKVLDKEYIPQETE